MPERVFRDRTHAGRVLAGLLADHGGAGDVVVLALPRGGVPVAFEVAVALDAPLDVFVVRKLGVPGHEELAMGAIASGGVVLVNADVVSDAGVPADVIERVAAAERHELSRREAAYREGVAAVDVAGRVVILVDDGVATGASMRAALRALRRHGPAHIIAAVPTAPSTTHRELAAEVDEIVCAHVPSPFFAVGQAYRRFDQVTDDEVRTLLRAASTRPEAR